VGRRGMYWMLKAERLPITIWILPREELFGGVPAASLQLQVGGFRVEELIGWTWRENPIGGKLSLYRSQVQRDTFTNLQFNEASLVRISSTNHK
jgi:hypothetical protein